jgi:hypothetical protein
VNLDVQGDCMTACQKPFGPSDARDTRIPPTRSDLLWSRHANSLYTSKFLSNITLISHWKAFLKQAYDICVECPQFQAPAATILNIQSVTLLLLSKCHVTDTEASVHAWYPYEKIRRTFRRRFWAKSLFEKNFSAWIWTIYGSVRNVC